MRTTVVLEPEIKSLVTPMASQKKLSRFINQCVREHFEKETEERLQRELSAAYQRANEEGEQIGKEFGSIDLEG